jgi:tetratricopeptide (TPR) repeat protein
MELCTGKTVKRMLQRGPLPLRQAVELGVQAASALEAAHRRGIVHRDIKPANLFVSPAGQLKVLDFGLAKLSEPSVTGASDDDSLAHAPEAELTRPGMAIGTVAYMSPEQALGHVVDARSDLFSLGAVLYEMVTGERAFPGASAGAVFDRILNREPRRASRADSRVPEELEAVLERMLAKQPEGRHASATELLAELEQVARVVALDDAASDLASTASRSAQGFVRRSPGWTAAGLAGILALAVGGYCALARPKPLTEQDEVLLAGFENKTGEAVFDATLSQALAVQLGQSPFLNIVADDRVRETLSLMGRAADERLHGELASEVCQRLSARALANGSISRLGELYVLLVEATDCTSGASLAREQGQAASAEEVLDTLSGMSSRLRTRVGESLRSVQAFDVPIARATTPSLEALRSYTLGLEQRRRGAELEAIPFLERALELDPGFAAAATTLSTVYGNLGEASKSIDYARLAYAQRDKVSQRERLFIAYQYDDRVTGNLKQAADTLGVWKRTFPNDFQPANALAIIHNRLGRYEEGAREAQDALARTPGHPFPSSQLGYAYRGLGRYEDARRVAEEVMARGVATAPTRRLAYQLAVLRGDAAAAAAQLEWAKGTPREYDMVAAEAQVAAFEGRLAHAGELYRKSVALAERRSLREAGRGYTAHEAITRALYGQGAEALALVRGVLHPSHGQAPLDTVPRLRVLTVLGLTGAPEASRMAQVLEQNLPDSTVVGGVMLPTTRAASLLHAGRPAEAVEALRAAVAYDAGNVAALIPRYLRGEALLGAGEPARARDEFQSILAARGADPFSPVVALAPLGVARALAALGEREKSAEAYEELFEAWRNADVDLPVLLAAREEHRGLGVR